MPGFNGFPREFPAFFNGLQRNNSKAWFERHRREYEQFVMAPVHRWLMEAQRR